MSFHFIFSAVADPFVLYRQWALSGCINVYVCCVCRVCKIWKEKRPIVGLFYFGDEPLTANSSEYI